MISSIVASVTVSVCWGRGVLFVTANALTNETISHKIISKIHTIQYFWKDCLVKPCPTHPIHSYPFSAIVRACFKAEI